MEKFNTIKLYGGMDSDFEIIRTNSPKEFVINQLIINSEKMENSEFIDNPYSYIEKMGYIVEILGCQDTCDLEDFYIDYSLDMYDYWEE